MTEPRYLTARSGPSLGESAANFIETLCVSPRDSVAGPAGSPIELRKWQRDLLDGLLVVNAAGMLRHRTGLVGMPRKNGKTALGAGLALWSLVTGPEGGEIYSVAGDREQARLCFGTARRMLEMSPNLSRVLRVVRDAIEYPDTGSVYKVRSAEAGLSEGLSPSFVIFDEVHVQPSRDLWDVFALGAGARPESLLLGITTAGVQTDRSGHDSLAYDLYNYGIQVAEGDVDDETFYFAWWGATDDADHRDPETWRAANPGFGDIVAEDDFVSTVVRTPESEFRRKRLNCWTTSDVAWLPSGAWEDCYDPGEGLQPGDRVVLGFDGSRTADSTVLVAVRTGDRPFVDLLNVWERPAGVHDWEVPVFEVESAIRAACKRFRVVEIAADPYLWQRSLQILADEKLPVVEFPQSPERMIGACQRFYEAVLTGKVAHSGNPVLARHLRAAATKTTERGTRIVKETSGRKIDAAIAAVMAHEIAATKKQRVPRIINLNQVAAEMAREGHNEGRCPRCFQKYGDGGARTHFCSLVGRRLR